MTPAFATQGLPCVSGSSERTGGLGGNGQGTGLSETFKGALPFIIGNPGRGI